MNDTPESSDGPKEGESDQIEKLELIPDPMREAVKRLYAGCESIKKDLQIAVSRENPILSDPRTLLQEWGIDIHSTPGDQGKALEAIRKGEIDLAYWIKKGSHPADSIQPKIILEGMEITGISLRNGFIGPRINDEKKFKTGQTYELELQTRLSEEESGESLFHSFYISDQGYWIRTRETEPIEESQGKSEQDTTMQPYDFEIAGLSTQILKSRLEQALASGGSEEPAITDN